MSVMDIPLIKGDKIDTNVDYRDALPVNMYAVQREILGAKGYMLCFPGLTQVATGQGKDRGAVFNDRFNMQYRVSGSHLIGVASDGTVTKLGVVTSADQCAMPYSFNTQCIIGSGNMYLYDATAGFRQVTDSDLGSPIDGIWINGYYLLTDGEYIYHTDITDESSIDPLKFATAEFMPDKSLAVGKTSDNKAIIFGRHSIEYFVDQANDNFAFTRIETRALKIGLVATHAKCEAAGTWFITGSRREESLGVYSVGIGSTQKYSSREVDKVLAQYTDAELTDMRMESRLEDGSTFIYVHLPNETLVLNVTIASVFGPEYAWSKLQTGTSGGTYRGINGVFDTSLGYWVYGDKIDGTLGRLDSDTFAQYGEKQEWYLYTPLVMLETLSINELEVETLPGHNTADDATLAFSLTYDGVTYGTEWWDLYGETGEYNLRYIQRMLGYVSHWIGFKFRGVTTSRMAFAKAGLTYG